MKRAVFAVALAVIIGMSVAAFAGNAEQTISGIVGMYYGTAPQVQSLGGNDYSVTGPGGTQPVTFTPQTIGKLEKLMDNPRSGDSLVSICPSQAKAIRLAMVGSGNAPSGGMKDACLSCWPRNPQGAYDEVQLTGCAPVSADVVVLNTNNPRYGDNTLSAKMEYHGNRWERRLVIRNVSFSPSALVTPGLAGQINAHFSRIAPATSGKAGSEGDSCFEGTWKVRDDGTYHLIRVQLP